jgi:hypothetical protein
MLMGGMGPGGRSPHQRWQVFAGLNALHAGLAYLVAAGLVLHQWCTA